MNYGSGVDWIRSVDPGYDTNTKSKTIMGYHNKDIDEGIVVDSCKVMTLFPHI